MDFREATGRLIELGVTLREMAEVMGVSHALLVQARMDPTATGHRNPPDGWREALIRIAEGRGAEYHTLVKRLKGEG